VVVGFLFFWGLGGVVFSRSFSSLPAAPGGLELSAFGVVMSCCVGFLWGGLGVRGAWRVGLCRYVGWFVLGLGVAGVVFVLVGALLSACVVFCAACLVGGLWFVVSAFVILPWSLACAGFGSFACSAVGCVVVFCPVLVLFFVCVSFVLVGLCPVRGWCGVVWTGCVCLSVSGGIRSPVSLRAARWLLLRQLLVEQLHGMSPNHALGVDQVSVRLVGARAWWRCSRRRHVILDFDPDDLDRSRQDRQAESPTDEHVGADQFPSAWRKVVDPDVTMIVCSGSP